MKRVNVREQDVTLQRFRECVTEGRRVARGIGVVDTDHNRASRDEFVRAGDRCRFHAISFDRRGSARYGGEYP